METLWHKGYGNFAPQGYGNLDLCRATPMETLNGTRPYIYVCINMYMYMYMYLYIYSTAYFKFNIAVSCDDA